MALEARELAVARRDDVEFILAHPVGGHRRRHQRRRRNGRRLVSHAGDEMARIAHQVELGRNLQIGRKRLFGDPAVGVEGRKARSEEHTSELQSLMRISYAVFCLKKKPKTEEHTYELQSIIRTSHTIFS